MPIAAFLIAMVGPMIARIIASLGMSLIVLTGLTVAMTTIKTMVTSKIGSFPAWALQMGGLMGIWEAVGIGFGAITFVVTWHATKGFWALAKS